MRYRNDPLGWMTVAALMALLLVLVFCAGCASCEDAPPCIPELKVVPGPPEEITVVGGELPISLEPELDSLSETIWPDERILQDPTGYEQALYQDLIETWVAWAQGNRTIKVHNAAFAEAWAAALEKLERLRAEQPDHD
jgi:hypothetical protein